MTKVCTEKVVSFDQTELNVYREGEDGPWLCLSNGLGGSYSAWEPIRERFSSTHRLLSWDYRGLFHSGKCADPAAVDVPSQTRDLLVLMDHYGIESAVHLGWSMGVQVLLELARQAPERIDGLILIGGASGYPFDSAIDGGPMARLIRPFIEQLHALEPVFGPYANRATSLVPQAAGLMKLTGVVRHTADTELLQKIASEWMNLDFDCYLETFKQLGEHDATDVLPSVNVPTLIVVGDKDIMTPVRVSETMHEQIKDSELFVVRNGTHYLPIEFPEVLNLRVEKFLRDRIPSRS